MECDRTLYVGMMRENMAAYITHIYIITEPFIPRGYLFPSHRGTQSWHPLVISLRVKNSRFCPICTFFHREFQSAHE